jgi:hypothetical protein
MNERPQESSKSEVLAKVIIILRSKNYIVNKNLKHLSKQLDGQI